MTVVNSHILLDGTNALGDLLLAKRGRESQFGRILQSPPDRKFIMDDFLLRHVPDQAVEKLGVTAHAKRPEPDLTLARRQLSQKGAHQRGFSSAARP